MRITQKDIARELGISLITVNRALNGSGYVSTKMRERIVDYAKANNYVPHKASQVLVRNKVRRVAVYSSSLPPYFWDDIARGVEMGANQIAPFDFNVRYHRIPDDDSAAYLKRLEEDIDDGVEAFAFANQLMYDMRSVFALAEKHEIPYVTFNVDAPLSKRLCYVGSDYREGGRLAAEFIGKTVMLKRIPRVLAIIPLESREPQPGTPQINNERLAGFEAVIAERCPAARIDIARLTTSLRANGEASEIYDLLKAYKGKVDAVYLIAAFNETFLAALDRLDYTRCITVVHDLDRSAHDHLESNLLSAVVYQNPILQGYYAVRTLERIVESGELQKAKDVCLVHDLVLAENRGLYKNVRHVL